MKIPDGTLFVVKDWDTLFENAASRKLKGLGWVPIPNGHDSLAYCRMMTRKDGPEIFAAWILIVQLASRCSERGTLASSDGRAYCPEEMAVKTRGPEKIFTLALPYLVQAGWLQATPSLGESANGLAESASVLAESGGLASGNRKEKKGIEKKTPLTPQDKLGGDLPENLNYDSFLTAWSEWEQHRKEIRKPLKPTQVKKQLKRLGDLGLKKAIIALNHTMDMGWQGIREPEPENPRKPRPPLGNNSNESILKDLERETNAL